MKTGERQIGVMTCVETAKNARNSAMNQPFLFWLTFVLRRFADKDGNLLVTKDEVAGITKKSNPRFPFSDPTPGDIVTCYFDLWFRSQAVYMPTPINIIVGYLGLVGGETLAISVLQRALELDVTGIMQSEILNELAKRDAVPLAYRILAYYCEDLSAETQADIKILLTKWLEQEFESTLRRLDMIRQALGYLEK